ncbi:heparanase-like [Halichondria panicea]|uniref:heparanase-like n=1 Tax=Halichondria panicea TaxID=6063 RepID=UPI00312B982D
MSSSCSCLLLLASLISIAAADTNEITVNLDTVQCVVSDQFLSVTIDAGSVGRGEWTKFDFTTSKMLNLAQALRPTMLRIGGTSQDYLIFQKNQSRNELPQEDKSPMANFNMTIEDWFAITQFVYDIAGWDFIFGLNVLLRNKDGSWDSSNARDLLKYSAEKAQLVNWELGNEPDLFSENISVKAEQLAMDFKTLKDLLVELQISPQYIGGPDVATLNRGAFFTSFLSHVDPSAIQAVTWHHYYLNGAKAVLPDMFNVAVLDSFINEAKEAKSYAFKYLPKAELWLGETSSCYGGGTPVLSSSFVSGFMWLDKLGVAALTNTSRVFRQDYIGGSYSLLDSSFNPLPDYWLSVLHKRLVGVNVLNVSGALDHGRHVRVYAHCARQPAYPSGDVVLLVLNLHTYDTTATLMSPSLAAAPRDVYWLSPPGNTTNVLSKEVALNGVVLSLNNDSLPDLPPLQQSATPTLHLPALSFGFYVFKDTKAKACM